MEHDTNGTPTAHDLDLADQIKQMGSGEVTFTRPPQDKPGRHRASRSERKRRGTGR